MEQLSASELAMAQKALKILINKELKKPMINFENMEIMVSAMAKIDNNRRATWNHEKFGHCEDMANEALSAMNPDDIPF